MAGHVMHRTMATRLEPTYQVRFVLGELDGRDTDSIEAKAFCDRWQLTLERDRVEAFGSGDGHEVSILPA